MDEVEEALVRLAEWLGVRVVWAERRHLTVRFDAAVAGPVVLGCVLMVPLNATVLAVNPRRRGER